MRQYLEIEEIVADLEVAEFIRSDVTDMTLDQRNQVEEAMRDIMSGKVYRLILHDCYHDEHGTCVMNEIKI